MLKEFCDRCHRELPVSRTYKDTDGQKMKTDERYVVIVTQGENRELMFDSSTDVLCAICARLPFVPETEPYPAGSID